ncbi:MAG: histidine kinase N-terminal 7TM domain-containing protein [bacterium]
MDIHGIVHIVIAALEILLGIYLLVSRVRDHKIYSYALFVFAIAAWVLSVGLYGMVENNETALFWAKSSHISSVVIAFALLYFSYSFPNQSIRFRLSHILSAVVPILLFGYLLYATDTWIEKVTGPMSDRYMEIGPTYTIFAVWFLVYMFWAMYNLYKKFVSSSGVYRKMLRVFLVSIVISFVLGTTFNLFLPWFGGPQMFYFGTESSVLWLGFSTYIILKKSWA